MSMLDKIKSGKYKSSSKSSTLDRIKSGQYAIDQQESKIASDKMLSTPKTVSAPKVKGTTKPKETPNADRGFFYNTANKGANLLLKGVQAVDKFTRPIQAMSVQMDPTLGLVTKLQEKLDPAQKERRLGLEKEFPKLTVAGKVQGYIAPGIGATKGVAKALGSAAKGLKGLIATETLANLGIGATESAIKGDSLKDIGKNAVNFGVMGGATTGVLGVAGKVVSKGFAKGVNKYKANQVVNKTNQELKNIDDAYKTLSAKGIAGNTTIPNIKPNNIKPVTAESIKNASSKILGRNGATNPTISVPLPRQLGSQVDNQIPKFSRTEIPNSSRMKIEDYHRIQTFDDLPTTSQGLEDYISHAEELQKKGITVNLQLFAEAQNKLKNSRLTQTQPKVSRSTINQIESSYNPVKESIKDIGSKLYTRLFNTNNPLHKFDKLSGANTELFASNSKRASSIVSHILDNKLVNKSGETIGESFSDIYKAIPKGKGMAFRGAEFDNAQLFNDYLLHKHNISRMSDDINKPVFGKDVNIEDSIEAIKHYESTNPQFIEVKNKLNKTWNDFFDNWAVGDLVSPQLRDKLREMYPDYVSTMRVQENNSFSKLGSKGFVNQTSVVKKAKGGSQQIANPLKSFVLMIDKTVKANRNNEVGLELLRAIRNNPDELSGVARIVKSEKPINPSYDGVEEYIQEISDQYTRNNTLKSNKVVKVMESGEPIEIEILEPELLRNLKGLTEGDSNMFMKIGRSITNPFKALITSKNPLFAIGNFAKDTPTSFINSATTNNPIKFTGDIGKTAKKMLTNDKLWQEYLALGGENANFFSKDPKQLYKKVNEMVNGKSIAKKTFDTIGDSIQSVNNFTESLNRFAEYVRTVEKGGNTYMAKMQGLKNAAEVTTDFSRHGDWIKALDSWIPYLNPAFQGLDKFSRNFKNRPLATTIKSIASITMPTMAFNIINKDNPEYQALDNRTKDTNYLIPMSDGKFFKIPKTYQNGAIFGSLFERLSRVAQGEDVDSAFKGFGNTLETNFSPIGSLNPLSQTVLSPAFYNLPKNKDFANRTIEPEYLKGRSPELRYDEKTSELGKTIGNVISPTTGLSPKQIDYLIDAYTGVVGDFLIPITTKGKKSTEPISRKFIADSTYNNQSINDFYDNKNSLEKIAKDKNFKFNIPSKVLTPEETRFNAFVKQSNNISDIKKRMTSIQQSNISNAEKEKQLKVLQLQIINISNKMNDKLNKFNRRTSNE